MTHAYFLVERGCDREGVGSGVSWRVGGCGSWRVRERIDLASPVFQLRSNNCKRSSMERPQRGFILLYSLD
jgi:hypothetical protein